MRKVGDLPLIVGAEPYLEQRMARAEVRLMRFIRVQKDVIHERHETHERKIELGFVKFV